MSVTLNKLRDYRLIGISIFDISISILFFYIIDYLLNFKFFKLYGYKYYVSIIPIGILSHLLIKQKTYLNSQLLSSELNPNSIFIKLLVLFCIVYLVI